MPTLIPEFKLDSTEARELLEATANKAMDMRPAMRVVKELLLKGNQEAWEAQGQPFGEVWPGNKPGTLSRKARLGQPARPLEASGALKTAIYGGKGRYSRVTRTTAAVGVRLFYARFHLGKGRLPKRQMVGITKATEIKAVWALRKHLGL